MKHAWKPSICCDPPNHAVTVKNGIIECKLTSYVCTVFIVPHTEDMVSQLFDPSQPKNISDILIVGNLAVLTLLAYLLPKSLKAPVFAIIFLFWRACYNAGIGWLLYKQSNDGTLVTWAKKTGIFEHPSTGKNKYPWAYSILKREMETKIPKDYKFEDAPLEYNTWLTFRRVVDLILMSDFTSYMLFAIINGGRPAGEGIIMLVVRWAAGLVLFFFNLWVKLDAHRVVKDFAWYWGDFFYLIDQNLTFDGVFEMAPHPMYSVGYAGYYGISLMAASYNVLFISIIAHAAQFAFLVWVESPHIEKTYSPPPPPRKSSRSISEEVQPEAPTSPVQTEFAYPDAGHINGYPPLASAAEPSPVHNLVGIQNMDLHRVTDVAVLLFQVYLFAFALLTPSTTLWQAIFVLNAFATRLWYSGAIGYILHCQSTRKSWTRHFIRYGESTEEAWRQWKGLYHLSMILCHTSFICASYKMYALPPEWQYGWVLLRHVVGVSLIALHLWTVVNIYETLGEFGWFFGDFFYEQANKLTYSGIYRYLNNPERSIGLAGMWGFALITWSRSIFVLALLSHILALGFIQFVEKPHMHKLYGEGIREDSGVSKTIKRSLPEPLRQWQASANRMIHEQVDSIEELIESARPKLAAGMEHFVKDSTKLFKNYPARISITRVAPDIAGYDPKDYSLEVEGTPSSAIAELENRSGREGEIARGPAHRTPETKTLMFEYGAPIKVRWTAPLNHGKQDWVGLYMVSDNSSRQVTEVSSRGRWVATNREVFDTRRADEGNLVSDKRVSGSVRKDGESKDFLSGEMEFSGDKLWWTTGVFEFRYHHNASHNVMAISRPFEIRIGKFDEDDVEVDASGESKTAVEKALLPIVQNCFDRDPEIAPTNTEEPFGHLVDNGGKYSKRVVFAVHQMFGIEFAPEVVQADGTVAKLAWRICNAKKVLVSIIRRISLQTADILQAPYSMSASNGKSSPPHSSSRRGTL